MSCVAPASGLWSVTSPISFILRRLARRFARGLALLVALAAGLLGAAGLAQAQTPYATMASPGPITNIFVGNDLSLQVEYDGYSLYQVYPPTVKPGDYGTLVVIGNTLYAPDFLNHGGRGYSQ